MDEISEEDLHALIRDAVAESRTMDYKRGLPGNTDADKKEFLADASSFANTAGGDLLFGMDENQGVPTGISGLESADFDLELRRLESILASGLDPRIRYASKVINCSGGKKVLIVRVERSWSGPHRVVFKGHDRFYGRNSAGKYALDVNELRLAFTLSSTVTERIRAFRTDRIIALSNNQTPVPFEKAPKLVLHCIPVESFASQVQYDLRSLYDKPTRTRLSPIACSGWNYRFNLEGLIVYDAGNPSGAYTQLYRNGVIEAVSKLTSEYYPNMIPSQAYEREVVDYLPSCFQVLMDVGANVPIVVALTLTNTHGLRMGVGTLTAGHGAAIQSNTIILPETVVDDFSPPVCKILKPMFDIVWNACGYPSSGNFDSEGNWVSRR